MSQRQLHPWDELPKAALPPAHAFAATRDWPGYFAAVAGRPPRETLLKALDRFADEGVPGEAADAAPPLAIDLGCGEGRDAVELLARGWTVVATDGHPLAIELITNRPNMPNPERLAVRMSPFESLDFDALSNGRTPLLINASFALPFCEPRHFDRLWASIVDALPPGGRFTGQLFGDRDDWSTIPDRSHHTRAQVDSLLTPFDIEHFQEEERDGTDAQDHPKHWHAYHIVARKH